MSELKHRMVPLEELARRGEPKSAEMLKIIGGALPQLRAGGAVKTWVEAVGQAKPAPEQIWVLISDVKPNTDFLGTVNSRPRRTKYHGLSYGDAVVVPRAAVIDILVQDKG